MNARTHSDLYGYVDGKRTPIALGESVCAYVGSDGRACWSPAGNGFGLYRVVEADRGRPVWAGGQPIDDTSVVIDGVTRRVVLVSMHSGSKPFADMDMTRTSWGGNHCDPRLTTEVA